MPIVIEDYDPRWPESFEAEAHQLAAALSGISRRIEHVGSTSVEGLAAKPVIDIQISVDDPADIDAYRPPLEALGFTYSREPFPYFHRPARWPHRVHVHVRKAGDPEERRTIAFRDWLRGHPEDRERYEELKRRLARDADAETAAGRFGYSEAKSEFVRAIEARAQK